ncbi:MAG: hypothetical protein J1F24_06250 [Oscillospiraceae bacterium]|nr:hypothetical protein [Oscillospiraceae bacterium]
MKDFYVNLEPREVVSKINKLGGEIVDEYTAGFGENAVRVTVYEQYYFRINGHVALTSIVDRVFGKTHVRLISAGGGGGILNFDLGATNSMEESVMNEFRENMIN